MSFKDFANKELATAHGNSVKKTPDKKASDALPKGQPTSEAEDESIKVPTEPKA